MFKDLLVDGKEFNRIKRERNHPYEYIKVSSDKYQQMQNEGWSTYKQLKKELKLVKSKSIDVKFADEIWVALASMGFSELSRDRSVVIDYKDKGGQKSKKIDILAVDDETVLLVICQTSNQMIKSDLAIEINTFDNSTEGLRKIVRKNFPGKKICFIYATCNYQLSEKDHELINESHLHHFSEKTVKYYRELAKHLGKSSRYQLLGNLFANTKIEGIPNKVPAIEGKMGGLTYYSFNIEPEKLLKFGYILHRNDINSDLMPTYQRLIKSSRLKKIREFVNNGGFFPNSIVINIDMEKIRFDRASLQIEDSTSKIGILSLPQKYRSTYIIDGQHRLYGYADTIYGNKNTIPVIAFVGLDKNEQVKLFMEINENQKTVPKNLQNTLNANLLWDSENENDKRKALRLLLAQELGEKVDSPLYDRIVIGENDSNQIRCITIESINIGLAKSEFFNRYDKNNKIEKKGVLDFDNNDLTKEKLFELLVITFSYFAEKCPEEWTIGEGSNGILTVNVGIYALIRVISDVIKQKVEKGVLRPKQDSVDTIFMAIKNELNLLVEYINRISDEERQIIRKTYGGGAKIKAWRTYQFAIYQKNNDFLPEGLEQWRRDNSKLYNEKSFSNIIEIESYVKASVSGYLQGQYGELWKSEVPKTVYQDAEKRASDINYGTSDNNEKINIMNCFTLKDCRNIIIHGKHWSEKFEKIYTKPSEARKKAGTKKTKTEWMSKLYDIKSRQNTFGYSVTEENYEMINLIYQWLIVR